MWLHHIYLKKTNDLLLKHTRNPDKNDQIYVINNSIKLILGIDNLFMNGWRFGVAHDSLTLRQSWECVTLKKLKTL